MITALFWVMVALNVAVSTGSIILSRITMRNIRRMQATQARIDATKKRP